VFFLNGSGFRAFENPEEDETIDWVGGEESIEVVPCEPNP